MKNWIIQNKLTIIGILVGAVAGYLYYAQIGCTTGTCAITSKPFNSMAYFGMMGGLAFNIFKKENKKQIPDNK